jgi:hypothetical protein
MAGLASIAAMPSVAWTGDLPKSSLKVIDVARAKPEKLEAWLRSVVQEVRVFAYRLAVRLAGVDQPLWIDRVPDGYARRIPSPLFGADKDGKLVVVCPFLSAAQRMLTPNWKYKGTKGVPVTPGAFGMDVLLGETRRFAMDKLQTVHQSKRLLIMAMGDNVDRCKRYYEKVKRNIPAYVAACKPPPQP